MVGATPAHAVVVCPPSRPVTVSSDRNHPVDDHRKINRRRLVCLISSLVVAAAIIITGAVFLGAFLDREFPTGSPVYTATVAAGLDDNDDDLSSSLSSSPATAFNLTIHIDNTRNSMYAACVPDHSTAAVSYAGVLVANATVPAFCADEKRESERAVAAAVAMAAWGGGGAVAGEEAWVDVEVTMPRYSASAGGKWECGDSVLYCKAKIGGGGDGGAGPQPSPSPACRLDLVKTCEDEGYIPPPVMFNWPLPPIYLYT